MRDDEPTATTEQEVLVALDGPVATVTLHRPDALNAITPTMLAILGDELERLAEDPDVRVVVLTGAGRAFSAGVDLKALGDRELVNGKVGDILDLPARRVTGLLSMMPKLTVAKVNGFCFTGALELAIACDLVIVAAEAKLGDTHAKWGLRPTWGMSARLPRLVGPTMARELSYTARNVTGTEAVSIGLAARSAPRDELDQATDALVAELLENSSESFVAYKDLYAATEGQALDVALAMEAGRDYDFTETDERLAGFR